MKAGGEFFAELKAWPKVLEGRTIFEAYPSETARSIEPLYRAALAGVESTTDITHGQLVFEVTTAPVRDGDSVIAGLVYTQNVTEQRQREGQLRHLSDQLAAANERLREAATTAETSGARYRALIEQLPGAVACTYDRSHRVTFAAGDTAARGFDYGDLIGRTPEETAGPDDAPRIHELLDSAFAGRPVRTEMRMAQSGIENLIDVVPLAGGSSGAPTRSFSWPATSGRAKRASGP